MIEVGGVSHGNCSFPPLKPMLLVDVLGMVNLGKIPGAVLTREFMVLLGWWMLFGFDMATFALLRIERMVAKRGTVRTRSWICSRRGGDESGWSIYRLPKM